MECKVCSGEFGSSPDSIVVCGHKEGNVHLGCCMNNCSIDKKPCEHAIGIYEKISTE